MTKEKDIKTVVPPLRFPEFRDAEGWETSYGCIVFNQISNKNHNSDLPILAISQEHSAIPRDMIDYNVVVTDKSIESYKVVDIDDFIISLRSFQGGIEHSSYQGICSPAYVVLRKKIDLNNQFFKHYFKSHMFIQDLNKNLEGIRDGKMVSYKQFSEILLPVPKPIEQTKIAECLGSLDDLISAVAEKIKALKEHKKGLMQQLFPAEGKTTPALRFSEFQNAGHWDEVLLSEVGKTILGLTYTPADIRDKGLLVLRSSNIKDGVIVLDDCVHVAPDIKRANLAKPNDILICVRNGSTSLIGKNALIPEGMPLCTHGAFMTVFRATKPLFVFQLFQTERYQNQVNADLGARINSINNGQLNNYKFLVPKPEEQQKIADCLSSVDELISAESGKLDQLKAHKKGLMQQLFPSIGN